MKGRVVGTCMAVASFAIGALLVTSPNTGESTALPFTNLTEMQRVDPPKRISCSEDIVLEATVLFNNKDGHQYGLIVRTDSPIPSFPAVLLDLAVGDETPVWIGRMNGKTLAFEVQTEMTYGTLLQQYPHPCDLLAMRSA